MVTQTLTKVAWDITGGASGAGDSAVLRPRYYDPTIGRFTKLDAFAGVQHDPLTLHKYVYCHNDPVNQIDPSGEFTLTGLAISTSIGAVLGGIAGGTYAHLTNQSIWKGALIGAGLGAVAGASLYLLWAGASSATSGALQRFFYDPRTFPTISRQYWQQFGPAAGRSLHHWLIPQKWTWIPQGIRNAGFNLLDMPAIAGTSVGGLNQWMGLALRWGGQRAIVAMIAHGAIKVLIPVTAMATYHASRWAGNELVDETIEFMDGATATPLQLTPAEMQRLQDDAGRALQEELDASSGL